MTEALSRVRLVLVTIGVMLALLLAALDQTIVGTAMPRIVSELQGLDYYSWVLTAYLVTSTTVTPIAGKLGDLFGRKPLLLIGMLGFVGASALCGQARDMVQLVAARGLQGIFGGVLFATVFSSIADIYEPHTRPRIQGLFGGIFGVASVVGPTIGGYLTDSVGWRWVFYVNLPLGLAATAFVYLIMPRAEATGSWRNIDFPGVVSLAGGLIPLLVALSITRDHAWTSPEVVGLLAIAVVVLVGFYFVERRAAQPIVPFWLFTDRTFAVSVITGFLVAVGMFGTIIYVPLIYQGVLGISATSSGALITPMMGGIIVGSVAAGQLMSRMRHYRFLGTFGTSAAVVGLLLLSRVTADSSPIEVVRALVITGLGVGTTFPLYLNSVQAALPRQLTGVVTSQVQFWRNLGATTGTAVLGSVLSRELPGKVEESLAQLSLPQSALASLSQAGSRGGADAQSLFDPARAAQMPAAVQEAIRVAMGASLHDIFAIAAGVVALGIVTSLFLKDVPLRPSAWKQPAQEGESTEPVATF
ncbi:MAG: DHA2 family efflux MFS transporter permease subunit [Chloroflexi bacterium]|nr:DHA2 family efflux MFS transporter permease subunit [Chloroflexota bacterium]